MGPSFCSSQLGRGCRRRARCRSVNGCKLIRLYGSEYTLTHVWIPNDGVLLPLGYVRRSSCSTSLVNFALSPASRCSASWISRSSSLIRSVLFMRVESIARPINAASTSAQVMRPTSLDYYVVRPDAA